jgi:phosphate transport system substrate-binding protein
MPPKRFPFTLAIVVELLFAAAFGISAQTPAPPEQVPLRGAGATFPSELYAKWFEAYRKIDPSVQFSYEPSGSDAGLSQLVDHAVDFSASDAPMSDEAMTRATSKILHLPTVMGAVVVSYNLPGVETLHFDGPNLADIFLGKITTWDDPAIVHQNPGVKLPDRDITVVHRSDASGTSYIFADYLSAVSPEWKARIGKNTTLNWPVGLGASGNEGVRARVEETPDSIGYFELIYVLQKQMAFAQIRNRDGYYVTATLDAITKALASSSIPEDFRFSMVNAPGRDAYPIASATWLLIYEKQRDPVQGKKLIEFLRWAETDGQKMAAELSFAPLPDNVRRRVLNVIGSLEP